MVNVNMGQQDGVQLVSSNGAVIPVPFPVGTLLEQATIDEDLPAPRLQAISRTSNLPVGTEEVDFPRYQDSRWDTAWIR